MSDHVEPSVAGRTPAPVFFRTLTVVAVVGVIALILAQGCDVVINPWAHSLRSSMRLTGSWIGTVPSNPGKVVFFDLQQTKGGHAWDATCPSCPDVEGTFRYCYANGVSKPYRIAGDVLSWRGSTLKLWFTALGPDFANEEMPATWNRSDVLKVTIRGKPRHQTSEPLPATYTVEFRHGSESNFQSSCASNLHK
jgi:hypothetical protein